MYPYPLFLGVDLYSILIGLAAVTALVIFAVFSNRRKLDAKYHNFILLNAVVTIVVGYGASVAFQAVYNWLGGDKFEISMGTGATFLGGLLGGAACFLIFYYGVGHFVFKDGLNVKLMYPMLDVWAVCIPAAHSVGRLGCLCAGCCHGAQTDAWYGIYMVDLGYKVVPTQLFESLFLAALATFLFIRAYKNKVGNLPLYMIIYGIWRFFAEYMRADDRGATIVSFLTPSQLVSVLLIVGGIAVYFILYFRKNKNKPQEADGKE